MGKVVICLGVSNLNAWILVVTYGFCFGVELTMTNVAALYFHSYHGASPQIAGVLASCFGLMNIFARSSGGIISDMANAKHGMRGRIWSMWIVQVIEGAFCVIMGVVTQDYASPDDGPPKVMAIYEKDGFEYSLLPDHKYYEVDGCATQDLVAPESLIRLATNETVQVGSCPTCVDLEKRILVGDVNNGDCIRNSDLLGLVVFIMILFSTTVQMAEGLHFGIVPYVSRPALGIVSGMVGAGGNLGSVIATWTFFKGRFRTDDGIVNLGIMIIGVTLLLF